ncbi:MAG TPA: phosphoribosylamine--glycine ligase, partial [Clostridiales bacterium]|nr:phosphoribosylamine--glycine ligase [Clostridiales bacterium]
MTVLVVGGGGREHAIVKKLSESRRVKKLYCAPGNAGIAEIAECLPIKATDIDSMISAAKDISADLVFVAPDDPLALGMVDRMEEAGIRAFGPCARAAMLEGSKVFSKGLMKKYGIPTAGYEVFDSPETA